VRLAVIPARGGSRRLPRKNIRPFCGKPVIAWSIEAARASGCFESIIVSTDDSEIADVARRSGAEVPFMRPRELADDQTGTAAVVRHAIGWHSGSGKKPDPVCCIYATAPFLTGEDLRRGLDVLQSEGARFCFPVARYGSPIQRALRLTSVNRVEMREPQYVDARSQDLEPAYHDAGQFYWGTAAAWLSGDPLFTNGSAAIVLPGSRVQDIDTAEDWEIAEAKFHASRQGVIA
jgi:N-acylneuraminate cytidylyltransferase